MGIPLCTKDQEQIDQCDPNMSVSCDMTIKPPAIDELEHKAKKLKDDCGKPKEPQEPCPAPPEAKGLEQMLDANRGVQQGAQ